MTEMIAVAEMRAAKEKRHHLGDGAADKEMVHSAGRRGRTFDFL
jgi:hypothetical protein